MNTISSPTHAQSRQNMKYQASKAALFSGVSQVAVICLLLTGMYFPTSIGGTRSIHLQVVLVVAECCLFGILILANGVSNPFSLMLAISIPIILAVATIFAPPGELTIGALIFYLPLSLFFCLNLRPIEWTRMLGRTFFAVNVVNLSLVLALILDYKPVEQFILTWYELYYDDLLSNMIVLQNKPVLTFGPHAIAAFMLSIFFIVNLEIGLSSRKRVWTVMAIGYLLTIAFLRSVSAVVLVTLGVLYLLYRAVPRTERALRRLLILVPLGLVVGALVLTVYSEQVQAQVEIVARSVLQIVSKPTNGFLGRFTSTGMLATNIRYLMAHPFRPFGVTTSQGLVFVDNGPIEYLLRGSWLLLIVLYSAYFLFLWSNLRSNRHALILFGLTLLVEIGFSYLAYFRFQLLMPVFIVAMNHAARSASQTAANAFARREAIAVPLVP